MKDKFDEYFKGHENVAYFFITVVIFLICYGLVFNRYIVNHDSIARIQGNIGGLENGRFLRPILNKIISFGTYNPMNNTILTYLFMFMSAIFINKLFQINSLFSKIIVTSTIFSFPQFGFFWMYGNDMWMYVLAFFIAVLVVFYIVQEGWKNHIIALVGMVCMLGIYQAMLSVVTSLFFIYYIINISTGKVYKYKDLVVRMIILVLGAVIYYIVLKLILIITGNHLTTYLNADSIGIVSIIKYIPKGIILAYGAFLGFLVGLLEFFANRYVNPLIHITFLLSYLFLFIKMKRDRIEGKKRRMARILLVFLPLAIYSTIFATQVFTTYNQFGLLIFVLGAIIISLEYLNKDFLFFYTIVIIIYLFLNVSMLQEMLFTEVVNSQQINSFISSIVYDLASEEGYSNDDYITFCGNLGSNDNFKYVLHKEPFIFYDFHLRSANSRYTINSKNSKKIGVLINTLGYKVNIEKGDCSKVENQQSYPKDGYITEYDGIYYIKLGEEYEGE